MKPRKRPRRDSDGDAVTLSIRVQPRAARNEIAAMEGGGLKIRLTAPPVDGAANDALVLFLADTLDVPQSDIEVVTGHTSREKRVRISGITKARVKQLLNKTSK